MLVLFVLGFVFDFLETFYIVIPTVGPVIYGDTFDPKWVTIMDEVNLQTSFLTLPFDFALLYLRGVAPKEVTTQHIYRGMAPFVLIQVFGPSSLWFLRLSRSGRWLVIGSSGVRPRLRPVNHLSCEEDPSGCRMGLAKPNPAIGLLADGASLRVCCSLFEDNFGRAVDLRSDHQLPFICVYPVTFNH